MWRNILGVALYQFLVMVTIMYFSPYMFDIKYDYYNYPFYTTSVADPDLTVATIKT